MNLNKILMKNSIVTIALLFGCCLLTACGQSSHMFNHTNDYKNCQDRGALLIPKGLHAQALSDQYAIPDLNPRKTTVAATAAAASAVPSNVSSNVPSGTANETVTSTSMNASNTSKISNTMIKQEEVTLAKESPAMDALYSILPGQQDAVEFNRIEQERKHSEVNRAM